MRRSTVIAIVVAAIVGGLAALAVAAALIVHLIEEPVTTEWERPTLPTAASVGQLRAEQTAPVFWFGPGTGFGIGPEFGARRGTGVGTNTWPLTEAGHEVSDEIPRGERAVTFTYGLFCGELDPGSGLWCENAGRVSTDRRRPASMSARRRTCWTPVGRAWLIDCTGQDLKVSGPRLLTADRVVRFSIPAANDGYDARPWRRTIGLLRRFDVMDARRGAAALPGADRLTVAEFEALGPKARAAVPTAMRPTRSP